MLQASFYGRINFQKFFKRAKKMQNSFSRRLGPTRTLYDQRFSSYGQKTTRCLKIEQFLSTFWCCRHHFMVKMTHKNFLKDLRKCKIHFREDWDQLELSTIDGFWAMAKKPKGVRNFQGKMYSLGRLFSFCSGGTSNFHLKLV